MWYAIIQKQLLLRVTWRIVNTTWKYSEPFLKNTRTFTREFGARFGETATIPRYMNSFCEKYQDKLLYGTDMGYRKHMYETTFRILESIGRAFLRNMISSDTIGRYTVLA